MTGSLLVNRSHLCRGLYLLLQGWEYARELDHDRWDFAVEANSLCQAGLSNSDLRWMVWKGYIEYAQESPQQEWGKRVFVRHQGTFQTRDDLCFVLTSSGVSFSQELLDLFCPATSHTQPFGISFGDAEFQDAPAFESVQPKWDRDRHELWFGGSLIKRYKLPSRNQETILLAFEEDEWAPRIDDPLPPHPTIDPKRRLGDTIKGLNRNQKQRLIRFMGDGSGLGIRWEHIGAGEINPGDVCV